MGVSLGMSSAGAVGGAEASPGRRTVAAGASSSGSTSAAGASGSSTGGGTAGLIVLTRRGGPSTGATGLGGSTFLAAAFLPPLADAGASANRRLPPGSAIFRWRATRSTNERATTSSSVLDALFSSMPWSRLSSASTSWLVVPSSSATL